MVGYGLAGEVFHCPLIEATPGLELAAIVTGNHDRATRAQLRYPGVRVLPTFEALLREPGPTGLLVVATPNHLHLPQAQAALEGGWHVVVDKPLALSPKEGEILIRTAADRGLLLTVFFNRRWDGDFLLLGRLLQQGRLGELRVLESRFERWRPSLRPGSWREERSPEQGGGLLLDLGSHLIDQALQLLGEPVSIYSELAQRRGGSAEDDCFLALRFADGSSCHLHLSAVAASVGPRFRALGMRGALETWGLDPQEEQLRQGMGPHEPGFGRGGEGRRAEWLEAGQTSGEGVPLELTAGRYLDFYQAMERAVQSQGEVPVAAIAGVRTQEVIEAARQSATSGQVVRIGGAGNSRS